MFKKYKKFLSTSTIIIFSLGGGWVSYQIYNTKKAFSHMIRTEVLDIENKRVEYIYINDPTFKEKVDLFSEERYTRKNSYLPSVVHWWKSWKNSAAWRLLTMAQTGDHSDRLQAVHSLVQLKHLKDSDYRQLAQACDAQTAISLARSKDVDLRFFLEPPYSSILPTEKELLDKMCFLLRALNQENNHPCIQYFLYKAFPDFKNLHKIFDHDVVSLEGPRPMFRNEEVLPLCLENLLHHSTIGNNARDIVLLGGLPLLMALFRMCDGDLGIEVMLASLLANISLYQELLPQLHCTGWIGVLAQWTRSPDIRLSAPAVKALANLDVDEPLTGRYAQQMYLLSPTCRKRENTCMDIVFVHGLLGGVFVTWRQRDIINENGREKQVKPPECHRPVSDELTQQYLTDLAQVKQEEWNELGHDFVMVMADSPEDCNDCATGPFCTSRCHGNEDNNEGYTQCWPRDWLAKDCHHLRVLGINYDTNLSMWAPTCPAERIRKTLDSRSKDLMEKLHLAGVGQRPVVWVSHSMGGLLVKNMLVRAWESGDAQLQSLCRNTKAVVFYSVPHQGSPLAALAQTTQLLLWPTVEVQELREKSPALLDLHSRFQRMLQELPMEVVSFAETKDTVVSALRLHVTFVPLCSADAGVGELFLIPQDHLCICKPATRQSFLYQKLLHMINKLM